MGMNGVGPQSHHYNLGVNARPTSAGHQSHAARQQQYHAAYAPRHYSPPMPQSQAPYPHSGNSYGRLSMPPFPGERAGPLPGRDSYGLRMRSYSEPNLRQPQSQAYRNNGYPPAPGYHQPGGSPGLRHSHSAPDLQQQYANPYQRGGYASRPAEAQYAQRPRAMSYPQMSAGSQQAAALQRRHTWQGGTAAPGIERNMELRAAISIVTSNKMGLYETDRELTPKERTRQLHMRRETILQEASTIMDKYGSQKGVTERDKHVLQAAVELMSTTNFKNRIGMRDKLTPSRMESTMLASKAADFQRKLTDFANQHPGMLDGHSINATNAAINAVTHGTGSQPAWLDREQNYYSGASVESSSTMSAFEDRLRNH